MSDNPRCPTCDYRMAWCVCPIKFKGDGKTLEERQAEDAGRRITALEQRYEQWQTRLLSEVADWLAQCAKTRLEECPRDDYHALNRAYTFSDAYQAAATALRDGSWRKG